MAADEQAADRLGEVVLVHELDVLVGLAAEARQERGAVPRPHDVVVDVRAEHDARTHDRHRALRMLGGPELAEPVGLGLVARVGEVGLTAQDPVLADRLGVVGPGAVRGGRGGDEHVLRPRARGGVERVERAVDVDVVHRLLVPDRVEDEGQVDERVGLDALEQGLQRGAVAHVGAMELGARVRDPRRLDVGDGDPLGVVAVGEELDQPRPDVAGAAGDHVLHGLSPRRAAVGASLVLPDPLATLAPRSPATWRSGYAAACKAVYTGSIPVVAFG